MDGFGPSSYGDAFADVYDEWYGDSPTTNAAVERLATLAGAGPVLELGIGTGRLAIPLAARGLGVWGIDASAAMLARLTAKPGGERVTAVLGDMAALDLGPDTPRFALAFVAANTLFNVDNRGGQAACFAAVARLLAPDGRFAVEAFVAADDPPVCGLEVRDLGVDGVVVTVSRATPIEQVVDGQHIEIDAAGVRRRRWRVWWSTPAQLDELAGAAGMVLAERSAGWDGAPFTDDSEGHVSVYRRM